MTFEQVKSQDQAYILHTYGRVDAALVKGRNARAWDVDGKEYIDFTAGIGVNALGYCDPEWSAAVAGQAGKIQHMCNYYYCPENTALAQELSQASGMAKAFFCNSGAEANECAIKAARKYAADKYGPERCKIVTLINSFHGRTIATLTATGQEEMHRDFQPLVPGFIYTPANDCEALRKLVAEHDDIAAFMFELVQGEGGVMPLEQSFVDCMVEIAKAKDILLVCDEVQTGNGRTGSLYAWMQYGFKPDIMSTAKGLGGGLPIGACLFGEKTEHVLTAGTHGSTFGGNPVVCAGALTILDRIDDKLLADVKAKSAYLFEAFTGAPGIKAVTGMGLMIGLQTEKPAAEVVAACMANGVLVLTAHGRVRLLPALNIPMELVKKAAEVIRAACA